MVAIGCNWRPVCWIKNHINSRLFSDMHFIERSPEKAGIAHLLPVPVCINSLLSVLPRLPPDLPMRKLYMLTGPPANAPELTDDDRDRLILEHLPQVEMIARKIAKRVGRHVDYEDLVSSGVVGLISAIDNFDPEQNVKLKTYAEYRIKGAILDSLRVLDNVPRGGRRKLREIEQAEVRLQHSLKRTPSQTEIAEALGLTMEKYDEVRFADAASIPLSLDEFVAPDENMTHAAARASLDPSPELTLAAAETKELLFQLMRTLPETQQLVIKLHYGHGMAMVRLAQLLNISEWQAYHARNIGLAALRKGLRDCSNLGTTLPEHAQVTVF
jgi:RNA polymerase sigma factor FliA